MLVEWKPRKCRCQQRTQSREHDTTRAPNVRTDFANFGNISGSERSTEHPKSKLGIHTTYALKCKLFVIFERRSLYTPTQEGERSTSLWALRAFAEPVEYYVSNLAAPSLYGDVTP